MSRLVAAPGVHDALKNVLLHEKLLEGVEGVCVPLCVCVCTLYTNHVCGFCVCGVFVRCGVYFCACAAGNLRLEYMV